MLAIRKPLQSCCCMFRTCLIHFCQWKCRPSQNFYIMWFFWLMCNHRLQHNWKSHTAWQTSRHPQNVRKPLYTCYFMSRSSLVHFGEGQLGFFKKNSNIRYQTASKHHKTSLKWFADLLAVARGLIDASNGSKWSKYTQNGRKLEFNTKKASRPSPKCFRLLQDMK